MMRQESPRITTALFDYHTRASGPLCPRIFFFFFLNVSLCAAESAAVLPITPLPPDYCLTINQELNSHPLNLYIRVINACVCAL